MLTPNQIPIATVPAEPSSMLVILLKDQKSNRRSHLPGYAAWENSSRDEDRGDRVKYLEVIADNLSKAGWSLGWVSALDSKGRTMWIPDAHRDGKRFVVRVDQELTAFMELEAAILDRPVRELIE